jgi:hypothetical protein
VTPVRHAVCLALLIGVAGCGCAASPERHEESVSQSANEQEAWGARFTLPDGWTGGENDSGGFEFTDGQVALMVGRHPLASGQTLGEFMHDRSRALGELGAKPNGDARPEKFGGADVLTLRASAEGGVEVQLLVARLGPTEGLSLMMVGEASTRSKLDAAWASVAKTLVLP